MTQATAQNPATISQADLDALRASLVIVKEDRKHVVRDQDGNLVKQLGTKRAAAELFIQNFVPDFTVIEGTADSQPAPQEPIPQETPVTETPAADLPVITAELIITEPADASAPEQSPAPADHDQIAPPEAQAPEQAPLSPEEQAEFDKKQARSQKLREAMAAVLAKPYVQEETHPSFKTKRGLTVTLQDGEPQEDLPAVLYHRAISSFSEKSLVDGVTFQGKPVPAARTRGTWRGVKTSFLWIEAPRLDYPASMVGASSKDTVTFHILIENDDWDNLEGAEVTAKEDTPEQAAEAAAAKAKAPKAKKAPWDKPTPTEDSPAPAEREHPAAAEAEQA